MGSVRHALVVTTDLDAAETWRSWLRSAGYATTACAGPDLTFGCPRLLGARCAHRDRAEIAIVDVRCGEHAGICTRLPADGREVYVSSAAPRDPSAREAFSAGLVATPGAPASRRRS